MKPKRGRKKARRRQSQDDSDLSDEPIYCICRSSQCDTFMIACDNCEEWYHGECINVSPKQAECIQTFYCQICRDKDPNLRIEFKNEHPNGKQNYAGRQRAANMSSPVAGVSEDETEAYHSSRSRKRGRKHSNPLQSRARPANNMPVRGDESSDDDMEVTPSQFASPSSAYSQSNSIQGSYSQRGSKFGRATPPMSFDNSSNADVQPHWRRVHSRNPNPSQCGECEGCKRTDDCGSCEVCRSPKFKQGRSRQRCIYRTCIGMDFAPSRRIGRVRPSSKISPTQSQLSDFDYDSHFDDYSSSRRFISGPPKSGAAMGSKMRRGDHLPGGLGSSRNIPDRGLDPHFPRRGSYTDVTLFDSGEFGGSYGVSPAQRGDRNGSSRYSASHHLHTDMEPHIMRNSNELLGHGENIGPGDPQASYESDEDVVLPEMRPCSGPACSNPAIRSRYCSEECQLRHESNVMQRPHPASRFNGAKEQVLTPYALPYPDHLYCKHHRMHSSQSYGVDMSMPLHQSGSGIQDVIDIYPPYQGQFVSSNQSANMDYMPVYDQITGNEIAGLSSYRRISNCSANPVNDDFSLNFNSYPQGSHVSKSSIPAGHPRQISGLGGLNELRTDRGRSHLANADHLSSSVVDSSTRSGNRIVPMGGRQQQQLGNSDVLPPELSLDAITPTVRPIRMYNGHGGGSHVATDYRGAGVNSDISQGDTGAELLSADATDLLDVDGNSSSGIGPAPSSSGASAFRQGDDFYMMNENENMEINWPTSPGGVVTASAGTA
uniref:CXXC-type zinc finger protein 1 n=1 Tax=Schistocephalus solidus TaxID=70667 RepID=A0A0X3Q4U4_SCHSO